MNASYLDLPDTYTDCHISQTMLIDPCAFNSGVEQVTATQLLTSTPPIAFLYTKLAVYDEPLAAMAIVKIEQYLKSARYP